MDLWGPLRPVLQTILNLQGDSSEYFRDSEIALKARMPLKNIQYCLVILHENEFISLINLPNGLSASIEAKGRLSLTIPSGVPLIITNAIRVVPKGLRSFDSNDSLFFLDLLPGQRDQRGLPESIGVWKDRIEETDLDRTFRIGLIYGPSGCGKSSLVRAGLLPSLAGHIHTIFEEATPDDTEFHLLKRLRIEFPDLPRAYGLVECLAAMSQGEAIPAGKKVLIILDQFEQWLHARSGEEFSELVAALRHCDGGLVQAIVIVRDDFWLATARFESQIGVVFRSDHNAYSVDLFYRDHAGKSPDSVRGSVR